MSVVVESKDFAAAVAAVHPFVNKRGVTTLLAHIRVTAAGGKMTLFAHSGEVYASRVIECDGECDVLLPWKALAGAASALPANGAEIEPIETGGATIKSGRSKFRLPGLADAEDHPGEPSWSGAEPTRIALADFAALMRGPLLAVGSDQYRAPLMGVRVERSGDKVVAVATDTHRLHYAEGEFPGGDLGGLIPGALASAVLSLPGDEIEMATLSNGMLSARCPGAVVGRTPYAGSYPAWERVVPSDPQVAVVVHRQETIDALRRMRSAMEGTKVVLDASSSDGLALWFPQSPEGQSVEDWVSGDAGKGGERIAMNPSYLIDALTHVGGETVRICYREPHRPATVQGDGKSFAVIMPMALEGL